jgi:hypothetical protein
VRAGCADHGIALQPGHGFRASRPIVQGIRGLRLHRRTRPQLSRIESATCPRA